MRFRAWRGLSDEYRARVEGHTPWPAGARDASPLLIPDVERDESVAPYRDVFAAEGIRAVAFIPMLGQNGVLGKFMLYYDKPHEFTAGEIHVAETIASHVAFATERKVGRSGVARGQDAPAGTAGQHHGILCRPGPRVAFHLRQPHGCLRHAAWRRRRPGAEHLGRCFRRPRKPSFTRSITW